MFVFVINTIKSIMTEKLSSSVAVKPLHDVAEEFLQRRRLKFCEHCYAYLVQSVNIIVIGRNYIC